MITNALIGFLFTVVSVLFGWLPDVTLASIPYIGDDVRSILSSMVLKWNAFVDTFPYAGTAWHIFLYVVVPFEITILILKLFLGHRSPITDVNNAN